MEFIFYSNQYLHAMWYESKVLTGNKQGRTIGFPTLNLDPLAIPPILKEGVYASLVKHNGNIYKGALFFGPRVMLNETHQVLEIYVFDFSKEIYGETVSFQVKDFIREVRNFASMDELKVQIKKDIQEINLCLNK